MSIQLEESLEKKVLVLGLERSGKSTLVSQIVNEVGPNSFTSNTLYKPTEGFHVTSLSDGASPPVNIWESKTIVLLFIFASIGIYSKKEYNKGLFQQSTKLV